MTRRLAAIMFTDLVGFTASAQVNEADALARVEEAERLLRPLLAPYAGRKVKSTGDGLLVEFSSALKATECAVEIQRQLHDRNEREPTSSIQLRIGIHVGDVEEVGGDILGDAVNLASRIEPLADPGGICISGPTYDQIRTKIRESCTLLTAPRLKGVELPLAVYRVDLEWARSSVARPNLLIGRETELRTLKNLLDDLPQGAGATVVISGEAGIGKDRLADEVDAYALQRGFRLLSAQCTEARSAGPYHPWVEILRSFVHDASPAVLHRALGLAAPEIAWLVPEIEDKIPFPKGKKRPTSEDESARLRNAVVDFLRNVAREVPVLAEIRNLNGGDTASLDLFGHVARRIRQDPILLLATCRDTEVEEESSLGRLLFELDRERLTHGIPLHRLGPDEVSVMIAQTLGEAVEQQTPEFVGLVYERTKGNPFFVDEVLRSLIETGTVYRTKAGWARKPIKEISIPSSVRAIIRRRVGHLNAETQQLLRVAAVLGPMFRADALARTIGTSEDEIIEPVEEALKAHLIREQRRVLGSVTYAFEDPQVRDVLYEEMSYLRRRLYHRKAAEVLEGIPGAKSGELSAELAFHFLRGEELPKALDYTVRAGERAAGLYAHEEALQQYRTAIELLELNPDELRRCQILEHIGKQEEFVGHVEAAYHAWEDAAEGFEKLGEKKAAAELLGELAIYRLQYFKEPEAAVGLLDRARKLLEAEPEGAELGRLYIRLAEFTGWAGHAQDGEEPVRKALAIAERLRIHDLEVDAHLTLSSLIPVRDREMAFAHLRKAEEIATRFDIPQWQIHTYFRLGFTVFLTRGDVDLARRYLQKGIEVARKIRDTDSEMNLRNNLLADVSVAEGNLTAAFQLSEELFEYDRQHYPQPLPVHICTLGLVAVLLGNRQRADDILNLWLSFPPESVPSICRIRTNNVLARWYFAQGDYPRAEEALLKARTVFNGSGQPAWSAALGAETLALLVESRLHQDNPVAAREILDELRALAQELDEAPGFGYLYRSEGLCSSAGGDPESSTAAFRKSIEAWKKIGWRYELARTLYEFGSELKDSGDSPKALPVLNEALELFTEMGAQPDAERTRALARTFSA